MHTQRLESHARNAGWKTLAALLVATAAPTLVRGAEVYGITYNSTPNAIYTLNTATGATTHLIDLPGVQFAAGEDMTFLNGTLYASDIFPNISDASGSFGSISLATGAFTKISSQGGSSDWRAMAANPAGGFLYVVDQDSTGKPLLSVTTAGTVSTIGATNVNFDDLAYDPNHNILYGIDGIDGLWTIDTNTGVPTAIGSTGLVGNVAAIGLSYDANTDTLYMNDGANHNFYTLNKATGARTLVGANGTSVPIEGLADIPLAAPEPGTVALLGLGATALGARRRAGRRRVSA